MKKNISEPKKCPKYKSDFTGDLIPKEYLKKGFYKEITNYNKVIGIYDPYQNRTIAYLCPDCGYSWKRK